MADKRGAIFAEVKFCAEALMEDKQSKVDAIEWAANHVNLHVVVAKPKLDAAKKEAPNNWHAEFDIGPGGINWERMPYIRTIKMYNGKEATVRFGKIPSAS